MKAFFPASVAVRVAWQADRPTALSLGGLALLAGILPNVLLISIAWLISRSVSLPREGSLNLVVWPLVTVGGVLLLALVLTPLREAKERVSRAKISYAIQHRLMSAVDAPVGTAHLEEPTVSERLAVARGTLGTFYPTDATATLARIAGTRLAGLGAVIIVGVFRWWLAIALLVAWLLIRHQIRAVIIADVRLMGGQIEVMRRAEYLRRLAFDQAAARELRVFGASSWILGRFREAWAIGMAARLSVRRRLYWTLLGAALPVLALYVLGLWAVVNAASGGSIGVAGGVAVVLALPGSAAIGSITLDDVGLEWMLPSLAEVDRLERDLTSTSTKGSRESGRYQEDITDKQIRFEGVAFRYPGAGGDVLTDLSLTLPGGRTTALVGINGAGKTTLVRLLARLYEPTAGRITVGDLDLCELDPVCWRRQIAIAFQDRVRYPVTLAENIRFGNVKDGASGQIEAVAQEIGLASVLSTLPEGWDTVLGAEHSGANLSGGQLQLVAVARALFAVRSGARLLVLDEPTAELDAVAEEHVLNRLLNVTPGVTKLLISHQMSVVRRADHIVVIDNGNVTEQGTHDELMARDGKYAEMFLQQASRYTIPSGKAT